MPSAVYRSSVCFNPRTHMGCDGCWLIIAFCGHRRFNPRTHMGCDFRLCSRYTVLRLFQSTHPHGVRPLRFPRLAPGGCFNPRTHMGCDFQRCSAKSAIWCFNPRTHMGCDFHGLVTTRLTDSFNPRTHMGCDIFKHNTII